MAVVGYVDFDRSSTINLTVETQIHEAIKASEAGKEIVIRRIVFAGRQVVLTLSFFHGSAVDQLEKAGFFVRGIRGESNGGILTVLMLPIFSGHNDNAAVNQARQLNAVWSGDL